MDSYSLDHVFSQALLAMRYLRISSRAHVTYVRTGVARYYARAGATSCYRTLIRTLSRAFA